MPLSRATRWTAAQVRALQDEERAWPRYELIDGELLVTPSPRYEHQTATFLLARTLADYMDAQGLGTMLTSPADLELEPGVVVQPDLFVVPAGVRPRDWTNVRALLLAAEVLSPSTARSDRVQKRRLYQRVGVPEYWVVDLDARTVERWRPDDERPELLDARLLWQPAGAAESFELDLAVFFARVHGWRTDSGGPMTNDGRASNMLGPNGFDIRAWLAQLPRHGWTARMLDQLPEQFRFEIIDGELLLPDYVWDPGLRLPDDA